ncbi:MAG: hypothetical protein Q4A03_10390 [Rothia sp. (in: high G+C Gram-positive bacteria)]|nr:hypothetical protein [Rothia sp. (in: high G+C Gram-positive bacteria)]
MQTLTKIKQIQALQEQVKELAGSQIPVGVVEVLFEQPLLPR